MNFGILGTGMVGRTIAGKLADNGHSVVMGTRDPVASRSRTEADPMGGRPVADWLAQHKSVALGAFAESAAHAEILFNCVSGFGSIPALQACDAATLDDKILVDVSNPLDFSRGFPPTLFVANDDSLAERIQRTFPALRVVKSLNTVNASVMVDPGMVEGNHVMYVAGNEAAARESVAALLKREFGWKSVLDLGEIKAARGMEAYVLHWLNIMAALGTPFFNVSIVQKE